MGLESVMRQGKASKISKLDFACLACLAPQDMQLVFRKLLFFKKTCKASKFGVKARARQT
jgi:hypothetical protein